MAVHTVALRDTRYETTAWGTECRRFVPRTEIERQFREWFASMLVDLSPGAFKQISGGTLFDAWQRCLQGRGLTDTRYSLLPAELITILEREGYDPMNQTGLPTELYERWQPVSTPPDFPEGDARETGHPAR